MKKLSLLMVVFSLGLFALGCEPAAETDTTDTGVDATAPATPDVTEDAELEMDTETDAAIEGDATLEPSVTEEPAPDAAAPDAAAPAEEGAAEPAAPESQE